MFRCPALLDLELGVFVEALVSPLVKVFVGESLEIGHTSLFVQLVTDVLVE